MRFYRACAEGNYKRVQNMSKNYDINRKGKAIRLTSKYGHYSVVNLLIEKGAIITHEAVHQAVINNHVHILKLFKNNGVIFTEQNLKDACNYDAVNTVEFLLESVKGSIHYAKANTLELFIKHGVNINGIDQCKTALMKAAFFGDITSLEILLNAGADVNMINWRTGDTALLYACREGRLNAVKLLLNSNLNVRNYDDKCPLTTAVLHNHVNIVELLLNQELDEASILEAFDLAQDKKYDKIIVKFLEKLKK